MLFNNSNIRLIQDILRKNMENCPDKIALICENEKLTYRQINEKSDRMAKALIENGINEGDRVLLFMLNSIEIVISIFATLKANAVYLAIDPSNTYETLKYIASDCSISAIVTYDHRQDVVEKLFKDIPSLKIGILSGEKAVTSKEKILSFGFIQMTYQADQPQQKRIENDLAYMIYTSGSTGHPKGVLVTHRCLLFTVGSAIEYFNLTNKEVHTSPLQLSFSPGINQLYQTFLVGGTLILEKSLTFPVSMLKRMEAEGATGLATVPTMLTLLMQSDLSKYNLSKLRYISSVGAVLPDTLIEKIFQKLPNVLICSYYGMAEASYSLCLNPEQIKIRPTSVGKPFPGTQAWIIDESGNKVDQGEIGTLVLRGSHVRSGYWNQPAETEKRFLPGNIPGDYICYSGDLFKQDKDGFFYFMGRSDEIIKSGAKKVVPKEIENALYKLDGVLEAAAVGVPDPLLGHAIKAFVVPTKHAAGKLTIEMIMLHCKQTLEGFKVPREIELLTSLPKTSSGKIIKTNLK